MSDRALLARLAQGPASGAALASELGISRSAVWKRIEALRAAGVDVQAAPGRGYALAQAPDLLDAAAIQAGLAPATREHLAGLDLRFEIDSTNAEALRQPAPPSGVQAWLAERFGDVLDLGQGAIGVVHALDGQHRAPNVGEGAGDVPPGKRGREPDVVPAEEGRIGVVVVPVAISSAMTSPTPGPIWKPWPQKPKA